MTSNAFLGLPVWLWLLAAVAIVVAVLFARRSGARLAHAREQEQRAQQAEASHESARTRHEGGA